MFAGNRLKEKREELGYSQEELGRLIGVSKVAIWNYEKGKENPKYEKFENLVNELDVEPNYLMNRDVPVVCEEVEVYHFKASNQEIQLIQKIRKDPNKAKQIYHDLEIK